MTLSLFQACDRRGAPFFDRIGKTKGPKRPENRTAESRGRCSNRQQIGTEKTPIGQLAEVIITSEMGSLRN